MQHAISDVINAMSKFGYAYEYVISECGQGSYRTS